LKIILTLIKEKPKLIAFYLPQFHVIPENDRWWGKGYTEWDRIKTSHPLFKGHNQPRVPYNYYDLSNVETMVSQAKLATENGIYGFCYYHYWFNGKKLLERPLEQMINSKNVAMPFCLSWANEPWTRAWEGRSKEILIRQEYGGKKEWEEHLDYLINFFKDDRYIKIDGRPVFLIYRAEAFEGFDKMILFWNKRMRDKGFKELFITETLNGYQKGSKCTNSQAVIEFEPMYTIGGGNCLELLFKIFRIKVMTYLYSKSYRVYDYDKVWRKIIDRRKRYGKKLVYLGAFVDWDNSPRFKNRSIIFKNVTPDKFYNYISQQFEKSKTEFLFINAWNEWSEGTYLEPDKKHGKKYLEAIRKIT